MKARIVLMLGWFLVSLGIVVFLGNIQNKGPNQNWLMTVSTVAMLVGAAVLVVCNIHNESKKSEVWECVAEGVYARVEYGTHTERVRHGAMAHTSSDRVVTHTFVFFQDERTQVCYGRYSVPFPSGTLIKVMRNGLGNYNFQQVDPPAAISTPT